MAQAPNINNTQKVGATFAPNTGAPDFKPAPIDGALRLSTLSGDATLAQDPSDPLKVFVVSGSTAGDSEVLVEADSRQGAEEVIISERIQVTVTEAVPEPAVLGVTFGSPEPK